MKFGWVQWICLIPFYNVNLTSEIHGERLLSESGFAFELFELLCFGWDRFSSVRQNVWKWRKWIWFSFSCPNGLCGISRCSQAVACDGSSHMWAAKFRTLFSSIAFSAVQLRRWDLNRAGNGLVLSDQIVSDSTFPLPEASLFLQVHCFCFPAKFRSLLRLARLIHKFRFELQRAANESP